MHIDNNSCLENKGLKMHLLWTKSKSQIIFKNVIFKNLRIQIAASTAFEFSIIHFSYAAVVR